MSEFPAGLISSLALAALGLLAPYRPMPWRWRLSLGIQLLFLSVIYLVIAGNTLMIEEARLLSRLSSFTVLMANCIVLIVLHIGSRRYG